ncbi:hypothetical protein TNIN_2661 [Trichonephila inaurata madagascariensis]|uniref:Transposase n=1 Tax=Trichonephila inaurata madagascariensis TaxID=2747483 RepID=A0A8X6IA91_9ARAC|nr:hypothetical protein TNIN_2661 [Trichonephila inaurata madagascariensis]
MEWRLVFVRSRNELVLGIWGCHFFPLHRLMVNCSERLLVTRSSSLSLVDRIEELGLGADHPRRDAHQNIRPKDNVETVRQSVADYPSISTRRLPSQLGISRTTLRRILLWPMAEQNPNLWCQQEGATAHIARQIMDLLRENFVERLISLGLLVHEI